MRVLSLELFRDLMLKSYYRHQIIDCISSRNYLAARFVTKNLFSCHPTVFINEADPVRDNIQTCIEI
jgi:hypothetical protein